VLIKRYVGSRLYNTETLAYVSLGALAEMLLRGRRFIVRETATGEDITRDIVDRLH
jgi:polyhydroxyalkanoate synthesis regulator protein